MPFGHFCPRAQIGTQLGAQLGTQVGAGRSCLCEGGSEQEHNYGKKELGLIVLIRVHNLPDVSRRTGGGCPGRRPLMTATWGSICSKVDIDGTCICLSTCMTITGNCCLFVQHLPHVEDTDCCSRSLNPAHFCVIHQHNSRPEQDQNETEI